MCGIAGIVAWDDRYHVTRGVLEKMSACIAHRGPDGNGLYLNHEQEVSAGRPQVGLVHRRLAILDPETRSNQPFTDEAGRWLVFNGEIYNYRELRQELKSLRPDYPWRTDGDTEVLLLAYAAWGEKCVDRLNGMFAFAVWDEPKQQLFLARDRMGQKPMYMAEVPGSLAIAFASEPAAIRQLPWPSQNLNISALHDYLAWGYCPDGATLYEGIRQLEPALTLTIGGGQRNIRPYFDRLPTKQSRPLTDDGAATRTRQLLVHAVRRQLVSDVPLGCFLSGGVDSSVIAAVAQAAVGGNSQLRTFSIGFEDPRYDETAYATAVAKHLGTRHETFIVRPSAADDLIQIAAGFGEPFGDSSALPTHYLARETRSRVKVCLSGDGGDELFGGYDRYRATLLAHRMERLPRFLRTTAAWASSMLPEGGPKSRRSRAKRFVSSVSMSAARRYSSYVRLFFNWRGEFHEMIKHNCPLPEFRKSENGMLEHYQSISQSRDVVQTALAFDRVTYLPGDLLAKVDRCSMMHALEVRSPFLDPELVQFAGNLTTDQLLSGGPKRMLREAFAADLPAFVFKRKKMGFAVPIGEWFRGELNAMLRDHLFAADSFASEYFVKTAVERLVNDHESQRVDHSQRLYALLMLELWWRTTKII